MAHEVSDGEFDSIVNDIGLTLSAEERVTYHMMLKGFVDGLQAIDAADIAWPGVPDDSREFWEPTLEENPHNAWYLRTNLKTTDKGPLAGRTVALKDNVFLAGVPVMNGSKILEGFVPQADASVVTRILDAGATITGKTNCESYCMSGGSHTSDNGPVRNPLNPDRMAGGSSSGSGAALAAGDVDMAIGCDQGGSIRMPASFCGLVGLKPTYGLVPYTGILGFEPMIDHVGPMTKTVADNALFLEVLAGPDGWDSRQPSKEKEAYTDYLGDGVKGLRIGVVSEGFGADHSDSRVDEAVRAAAHRFEELGATVGEISIPAHKEAFVMTGPAFQATVDLIFGADGALLGRDDPIDLGFLEHQAKWRTRPDDLPETIKFVMMWCNYLKRNHGYKYWAMSRMLVHELRVAYDAALTKVDLLVMPTTTTTATPFPPEGAGPAEVIGAAFSVTTNTGAFNFTHHPAMSLPCGDIDGLPAGMMLVGRHFDERTIYRAAQAFEQAAL